MTEYADVITEKVFQCTKFERSFWIISFSKQQLILGEKQQDNFLDSYGKK